MSKRDPSVRAFLDKQVHIATEHFGKLDPLDLDEYLAHGGFEALAKCLGMQLDTHSAGEGECSPASENAAGSQLGAIGARSETGEACSTPERPGDERDIISTIEKSGLRGRGGAGSRPDRSGAWSRSRPSDTKYVICNGDEGDPGAFMDRMILESFPFRVIEGLAIAAVAVGAHEGIFYIRHEYPLAVKRVRAAIAELEKRGWLGEKLLGGGRRRSSCRSLKARARLSAARRRR